MSRVVDKELREQSTESNIIRESSGENVAITTGLAQFKSGTSLEEIPEIGNEDMGEDGLQMMKNQEF